MTAQKVSLIATVLNERGAVERWLQSIRGQTRLPDEIVICDGGSTDGTVELIEHLAQEFNPPLRLIEKPGANIAVGRNAAIEAATSGIVAVSDVGAHPEPTWFFEIVKPFETDPATQAVAGSYRFQTDTRFKRAAAAYLGQPWLAENFLPSSRSVAFSKSAWKESGKYPEYLTCAAEDTLFNQRLVENGFKFAQAKNAIVHWELRSNVSSFLKMIWRNAFGDAEAGQWQNAALTTCKQVLLFLFVVVATTLWVPSIIIIPTIFFVVKALTRRVPLSSWPEFIILCALGGCTYIFGYVHGRWWGNRLHDIHTANSILPRH